MVKSKIIVVFYVAVVLLSLSAALSSLPLNIVYATSPSSYPKTYRGLDYIDVEYAPGKHTWKTMPQTVWNGSHWVDYIFQDLYASQGKYVVQVGLIGVEIYDYYAKFYDPNITEVRLYDERWEVQKWKTAGPGNWEDVGAQSESPVYTIVEDDSGVNITKSFHSWAGWLNITYVFHVFLKHNIVFTSDIASAETFQVLQKWSGIVGTKCKHQNETIEITSPIELNGTEFEFLKADEELSVLEDQWAMEQYLKPVTVDVHAQGMKCDFVFGNWTKSYGEAIQIDPTSITLKPSTTHKAYKSSLFTGAGLNPSEATIEFNSGEYTNVQSDDGSRVGRTTDLPYGYSQRFTFNLTSYDSDGWLVENVTYRWDGIAVKGSADLKVMTKTFAFGGNAWTPDTTLDTNDIEGWETTKSFTDIIQGYVISTDNHFFEFGVHSEPTAGDSSQIYTDAIQIEIYYSQGMCFPTDENAWEYIRSVSETYADALNGDASFFLDTDVMYCGQIYSDPYYAIYRTFLGFDTSPIPDGAYNFNGTLWIKTWVDMSATDFTVEVWNASWGSVNIATNKGNWTSYDTKLGDLFNTADYIDEHWFSYSGISSIDAVTHAQFMLRSSREGTIPSGDERIEFYPNDGVYDAHLVVNEPTIGEFQAPTTVYANQYFFLNASINDDDGIADFDYATIEISNSVVLKWTNSTNTFSEQSDSNNYCTLDAGNSIRGSVNSTAYKLSWKIKLTWTYPEGSVGVIATNTGVYDDGGESGSGSSFPV